MWQIIQKFLYIIFEPTPAELLVQKATEEDVGKVYREDFSQEIIFLHPYQDELIHTLIQEVKFHANTKAQSLLASSLEKYFHTLDKNKKYIILPIPLSKRRIRERGYNQITEILKQISTTFPHITIVEKVLIRIKNTYPQTKLSREKRLTNVHDCFSTQNQNIIQNSHVIIIDDVTTTGTTLREAKRTLSPFKPASIHLLALTH